MPLRAGRVEQVLCRLPIDPGILVLHAIAKVFLRVKTFVFDLPAHAPGGAEYTNRFGSHIEVGQVNKAVIGLLGTPRGDRSSRYIRATVVGGYDSRWGAALLKRRMNA